MGQSMHPRNLVLIALALRVALATADAQEGPTTDEQKIEHHLRQLRGKDRIARSDACKELCKLGPKAKPAVPELIKMLSEKDDISRWPVIVLAAIGPDAKAAVPALIERMKSKGARHRVGVPNTLACIGQPEAVPVLVQGLKDSFGDVRIACAGALFKMGKHKKEALATLRKELKADFWGFRVGALQYLQRLGPEAKEAVPDIINALTDDAEFVREAARNALRSIDSETAKRQGID
jgi:HEAT repeat protein